MIQAQQGTKDVQLLEGVMLIVFALSATLSAVRAAQKALGAWQKAARTFRGSDEAQGDG